jgi:hypothetical protein
MAWWRLLVGVVLQILLHHRRMFRFIALRSHLKIAAPIRLP